MNTVPVPPNMAPEGSPCALCTQPLQATGWVTYFYPDAPDLWKLAHNECFIAEFYVGVQWVAPARVVERATKPREDGVCKAAIVVTPPQGGEG